MFAIIQFKGQVGACDIKLNMVNNFYGSGCTDKIPLP